MQEAGFVLAALGCLMLARGLVYIRWPTGRIAEKRRRRNLKVGFTTDMRVFGRKVCRLGLLLALIGAALVGFDASLLSSRRSTTMEPRQE